MMFLIKKKYFKAIKNGLKTVDLRKLTKARENIKPGDEAVFVCGRDVLRKEIQKITKGSLEKITKKIDFKEIVPWAKSKQDFVDSIREIYPEEERFIALNLQRS